MNRSFKYFITVLTFLGCQNLFSQNSYKELQPIIEKYLETNLDSAEKYTQSLFENAYEFENRAEKHHAYNYLAHIAYKRGKKMEALENFMTSLEIRKEIGTATETANTLNWIGRIHHENTDYDKALKYYFLSLDKLKKTPDSSYILSTLNNLTRLYLDIGDDKKMIQYNNQTLLISALTNDNLELANASNLRGIYFQNRQELDSAEYYYQKALSYYIEINFPHKIAHQYNNLGIIYFVRGDLKASYRNFHLAKQMREEENDTLSFSESLRNLGDYFFYTENYDSSLYYYGQSLRLASSINSKTNMLELYESLSELYYEINDFKKAYSLHLQYSDMQEYIFSTDQFDKLREMEAKYQFNNQNEQLEIIKISNEKLNEANETLEKERNSSEIWIYSLALLCLALAGGCVWLFKKNKSNSILKPNSFSGN